MHLVKWMAACPHTPLQGLPIAINRSLVHSSFLQYTCGKARVTGFRKATLMFCPCCDPRNVYKKHQCSPAPQPGMSEGCSTISGVSAARWEDKHFAQLNWLSRQYSHIYLLQDYSKEAGLGWLELQCGIFQLNTVLVTYLLSKVRCPNLLIISILCKLHPSLALVCVCISVSFVALKSWQKDFP